LKNGDGNGEEGKVKKKKPGAKLGVGHDANGKKPSEGRIRKKPSSVGPRKPKSGKSLKNPERGRGAYGKKRWAIKNRECVLTMEAGQGEMKMKKKKG